jgi:threonine dehydratase
MISADGVYHAEIAISNLIRRTPTIQCPDPALLVPEALPASLFFKLESFQKTGSFKYRGASNAVSHLVQQNNDLDEAVLVTVSSGNFAQALAKVAQEFHIPATIVMPSDTSKIKVDAVREYGATVEFCDPNDRDGHCARVVERIGQSARFIHPSENPFVIHGNGTLLLEMIRDVAPRKLDVIVCPVGGGGVISGISAVAREAGILVVGAEPLQADDAYWSKRTNRLQPHRTPPNTIAEGYVVFARLLISFILIFSLVDTSPMYNIR